MLLSYHDSSSPTPCCTVPKCKSFLITVSPWCVFLQRTFLPGQNYISCCLTCGLSTASVFEGWRLVARWGWRGATLTQTNTNQTEWQGWRVSEFYTSMGSVSNYVRIEGWMPVLFSGSFWNATVWKDVSDFKVLQLENDTMKHSGHSQLHSVKMDTHTVTKL